jgi:hypothetical protein
MRVRSLSGEGWNVFSSTLIPPLAQSLSVALAIPSESKKKKKKIFFETDRDNKMTLLKFSLLIPLLLLLLFFRDTTNYLIGGRFSPRNEIFNCSN